jgi:hypothetical protein
MDELTYAISEAEREAEEFFAAGLPSREVLSCLTAEGSADELSGG